MFGNFKKEYDDFKLKAAEKTEQANYYIKTLEFERSNREQSDKQVIELLHNIRDRYNSKINIHMAKQKKSSNTNNTVKGSPNNDDQSKKSKQNNNKSENENKENNKQKNDNGWGTSTGDIWGNNDQGTDQKDTSACGVTSGGWGDNNDNNDKNNGWGDNTTDNDNGGWNNDDNNENKDSNDWGNTESNNDTWTIDNNNDQKTDNDWGSSTNNKNKKDVSWGDTANKEQKTSDWGSKESVETKKTDWGSKESIETKKTEDKKGEANKKNNNNNSNKKNEKKKDKNDEKVDGSTSGAASNNTKNAGKESPATSATNSEQASAPATTGKTPVVAVDKITEEKNANLSEVKSQLWSAKLDLRLVKREKSNLEGEMKTVKDDRDKWERKYEQSNRDYEELKIKVRGLTLDLCTANEEIDKLNKRIDELETERRARDRDVNFGENKRKSMEEKSKLLLEKVAKLQNEVGFLEEEKKVIARRADDLARRNTRLEADLTHTRNLMKTLKEGCCMVDAQVHQFEERHDHVLMSKAELEAELVAIKEESSKHISAIANLQRSNEQISEALTMSIEAHNECQNQFEILQSQYDKKLESYSKENQRLQTNIAQLRKLVDFMQNKERSKNNK